MPTTQQNRLLLALPDEDESYIDTLLNIALANQVAGWRFNETAGTTAEDATATNADGTYTSGYTLNQAGIGDDNPAVLFNGTDGRVSLTPALAALNAVGKFNGAEGSAQCWCYIPVAGVWSDGTSDVIFSFGADTNNRVFVQKSSITNEILASYRAGGTVETIQFSFTSAGWFHVMVTWSKAAEQFKLYINGLQAGATATALGTWVGALVSTFTAIAEFRSSAPSIPWNGLLAYPWLWNAPLSAEQVQLAARTA